MGIVQVTIDDLFRERERSVQPGCSRLLSSPACQCAGQILNLRTQVDAPLSDDSEVVLDSLVVDVVARLEGAHLDLGIANPGSRRSKASPLVREGGADDI